MPAQVVQRAFRRGDDFDVELLEQRARPEFGPPQRVRDDVIMPIGVVGRQPLAETEQRLERMIQPEARRRARKQPEMLGEAAPNLSRIGLDGTAVDARHAEVFQRHALAVEHAKDIVVRRDEQSRGVFKRLVLREPARIGMAVRGDDRKVSHLPEQAPRDGPGRGVGGKEAVVVHHKGSPFLRCGAIAILIFPSRHLYTEFRG